jgi:hypothetical protein
MTKRYHGHMPELLLLHDVPYLGKAFTIHTVSEDTALSLMAKRLALHPTPLVRKRYEMQIREAYQALSIPAR